MASDGSLPDCHCAICSKLPASNTPAYWSVFNDRVLELWHKYDAHCEREKALTAFTSPTWRQRSRRPNLDRLGKIAAWFQADNQGRTSDEPAVWGCSLQGRVCNAMHGRQIAANVTAAYSTGTVRWRNASKNPDEARMWLNETLASGMAPYFHFVGSRGGFGEDRRWQAVGEDYFRWTARTMRIWRPGASIANIGVVIGQETQLDLYEQCSFHIAETTPSSVNVGVRPIRATKR